MRHLLPFLDVLQLGQDVSRAVGKVPQEEQRAVRRRGGLVSGDGFPRRMGFKGREKVGQLFDGGGLGVRGREGMASHGWSEAMVINSLCGYAVRM